MRDMHCYDRKGNPISIEEWGRLLADPDYKIVAQTGGSGRWVSTVWLGLDHSFGGGPPLIFESMVFKMSPDGDVNYGEIDSDRYSTEEEARIGHGQMCEQHAYVLDRIAKELNKSHEAVDRSGYDGTSEIGEGW